MSDQIKESVSVLMDGEASELDLERVLKHVDSPEVRKTWVRYHAIRRGVSGRDGPRIDADISRRVMAEIGGGQAPVEPPSRWRNVLRPVAGLAVAASFFAAVLFAGQQYLPGDASQRVVGSPVIGVGGTAVRAGYATQVSQPAARPLTEYDSLARQRLRRYMLHHAEAAALNGSQGMMPIARAAALTAQE